jgi:ABC-type antimicrobial peptide transport system permease subunit
VATVIGIVGDVRQVSLAAADRDAVYVPAAQVTYPERSMWLVARGRGDVVALTPAIEAAIRSVDKDQPITRVNMLDDVVTRSAGERRFALLVFAAFAVIAIVLAAVGIYGVLAASVSERSREIGLRAALGASPKDVLRMIILDAGALAVTGLAAGVAGAWLSSRLLVTLLFDTSRLDPVTYLAVGSLLLLVAALATVLPARRASRLDPALTLRMD